MARLKKHPVLEAMSGSLGKELVFKQYTAKVVVSRYPDMSKVKPSARQTMQRTKMKEATAYASFAKRDPELRARYEKNLKPGESVYHKAIKDHFERLKQQ